MKYSTIRVAAVSINIEDDRNDRAAHRVLQSLRTGSALRVHVGQRTFMSPSLLYEIHWAVSHRRIRLEIEASSQSIGTLWVRCVQSNGQAWELTGE